MPLLTVEDLKTYYITKRATVRAVDGVSFDIEKGQSLGIAGESGCGKSTVALSLMRLVKGGKIVGGKITLDGQSLLELSREEFNQVRWKQISLVPQAAMDGLNPVYRVGDQIAEAIMAHTKLKKAAAMDRARELLRQVEIEPSRARSYPHEMSGGMCQRAMIAMALSLNPRLVIADEPTTALDVVTQAQILKLMRRLQRELDISIAFISHDLSTLAQACDRIVVMYAGKVMELGDVKSIFAAPRHSYTRALLASFPDINNKSRATPLPGSPPDLSNPPAGCRFHLRCPEVDGNCKAAEPALAEISPGHYVACHRAGTKGVS